ncbi:FtsJ-like methyltransferase family protein [Aspergillus keveii]|uniref:FtsJ-like methyltransferase family protein n=1 Tax=Aspergillus keveii TaxID=714993 RepID=A0ABR4GJP3_9EURO
MTSPAELQESKVNAVAEISSTSEACSQREPDDEQHASLDRRGGRVPYEVVEYLLKESLEFRRLSELRKRGWANPAGDRFFEEQRRTADTADEKTAKGFYDMMKHMGQHMNNLTGVLRIKKGKVDPGNNKAILDMCMAPGGFLATALRLNPGARAVGFSLPTEKGGHKVRLPWHRNVTLKFLDITMLAADMGVMNIPAGHPDAANFLPRHLKPAEKFDLVLCDGQVLRTHDRENYRKKREAARLTLTQLALGLGHMKPGGSMVVLLHKVEALNSLNLMYTFEKFASVRLYKHPKTHAKRSSFYMLATDIRADSDQAATAIQRWTGMWKVATFGTDEMYHEAQFNDRGDVAVLLQEFGPMLMELGRKVWEVQANALEKASFVRENTDEAV